MKPVSLLAALQRKNEDQLFFETNPGRTHRLRPPLAREARWVRKFASEPGEVPLVVIRRCHQERACWNVLAFAPFTPPDHEELARIVFDLLYALTHRGEKRELVVAEAKARAARWLAEAA